MTKDNCGEEIEILDGKLTTIVDRFTYIDGDSPFIFSFKLYDKGKYIGCKLIKDINLELAIEKLERGLL